MFVQLNPPLPLQVLDKGPGYAIAIIDYGQEHDIIWVTALDATGEIWCAPNGQVRMQKNWSLGRNEVSLPSMPKAANGVNGSHHSPAASNGQA